MKRAICGGVLALSALILSAEDAPAKKDPASPAPVVNREEAKFLNRKMTMEFLDTPPADALEFQMSLMAAKLTIASTAQAKTKTLPLRLKEVSGAEVLRIVSEKTELGYRFAGNTLRLAPVDEWKEIDAGSKTFEELAK